MIKSITSFSELLNIFSFGLINIFKKEEILVKRKAVSRKKEFNIKSSLKLLLTMKRTNISVKMIKKIPIIKLKNEIIIFFSPENQKESFLPTISEITILRKSWKKLFRINVK